MRLRVARAFKPALRKIANEMATHFIAHRLGVLLFAQLRRLLGEADILTAAPEIDERRQQLRHRSAKDRIEGWAQKRLLNAAFEMKKDLGDAMKEPEKHPN